MLHETSCCEGQANSLAACAAADSSDAYGARPDQWAEALRLRCAWCSRRDLPDGASWCRFMVFLVVNVQCDCTI